MSKKITKTYETIFILDAVLDDDKAESVINKYADFLTKNGSTIIKIDRWGRKKFAYPIKKKFTGYYASIEFSSAPGIVAKLDRTYHLDDNILRFLTISYDKKTYAEREAYFEKRQQELAEKEAAIEAEASQMAPETPESPDDRDRPEKESETQ
jgi:small subunit ribosomal protein S6